MHSKSSGGWSITLDENCPLLMLTQLLPVLEVDE